MPQWTCINHLVAKDLPTARQKLSWIVGRDTDNLDEQEITRGVVETVSENISDGITAPLFYAFFLPELLHFGCIKRSIRSIQWSVTKMKSTQNLDMLLQS